MLTKNWRTAMIVWRPVCGAFFLAFLIAGMPVQSLAQKSSAAYKWSGDGLSLELAPLSADQVRGFFIGRGFSAKQSDYIAQTGCVFRSAIGNSGNSSKDPGITIKLRQWRIINSGASEKSAKPPMTREEWANVWSAKKVGDMPKIAFHWALFPTEQQYNPTDYNWGMITFALQPGTKFDLKVIWSKSGLKQSYLIKGLECGR